EVGLGSSPFFNRMTSHQAYIGPRLARKWSTGGQPVSHPYRAGIVCGGCKPKVSKFTTQVAQQLRGLGNRFVRIERVFDAARSCRFGHKLRYALCTCSANRVRVEATFLPDKADEEIDR